MTVVFLSIFDGAKTRSRQHSLVSFAFLRVYPALSLDAYGLHTGLFFLSIWFSNEIARGTVRVI